MTAATLAAAADPRRDRARPFRAVLQTVVLLPVVRWFARPLLVQGVVPSGPVVFVANHASHADTCALLAALPADVRARTHPAAAADYFFAGPIRARLTSLLFNAFAFRRRGGQGLALAEALLARGQNVLLFPEGTRSCDGSMARFRRGVGVLAARGATIVPVGLAGTGEILPKGSRLPRRRGVVIRFGVAYRAHGIDPAIATARVERRVRRLVAEARAEHPALRPSIYERVARFARSPSALVLLAGWGFAEALVLPVVPDVPLVVLALAAPARAPVFVAMALAGSLAGGASAFMLGAVMGPVPVENLPLVTERMAEAVRSWFAGEGAAGLAHQPWSGVPFKAFAFQAAPAGVDLGSFAWEAALARGARFLAIGAAAATMATAARAVLGRIYVTAVATGVAAFGVGLARVVERWS